MYIIAHKLYQAQKRPSSLLIQCPMDHHERFEQIVIPEGATSVGKLIWRGMPYMEPEVITEPLIEPSKEKSQSLVFVEMRF